MRTAVYIEDGATQIVLTPETDFEKMLLQKLESPNMEAQLFSGSFYDCQGGWTRQREGRTPLPGLQRDTDNSLIVRVTQKTTAP
jgi:hypothetical protein